MFTKCPWSLMNTSSSPINNWLSKVPILVSSNSESTFTFAVSDSKGNISAPTLVPTWCCGRPQNLSSPAVSAHQQRPTTSPAAAPATQPSIHRSPWQPLAQSPWWPPACPLATLSAHLRKSRCFFCIVSNFDIMKTDIFSACWVILVVP